VRFNLERKVTDALGVCVRGMSLGRPVRQWVGSRHAPWAPSSLGLELETAADPGSFLGPFYLMGSNPPDGANLIPQPETTTAVVSHQASTQSRTTQRLHAGSSGERSCQESDSEPEPDLLPVPAACSLGIAGTDVSRPSRISLGNGPMAADEDGLYAQGELVGETVASKGRVKAQKYSDPEPLFPIKSPFEEDETDLRHDLDETSNTRVSSAALAAKVQSAISDPRLPPAERQLAIAVATSTVPSTCEAVALQEDLDALRMPSPTSSMKLKATGRKTPPEHKNGDQPEPPSKTTASPCPSPDSTKPSHFLFCVAPKAKNAEFVRSCVPTKSHITDIIFIAPHQAIVAMGNGEVELYSICSQTGAMEYLDEATWLSEPIIQMSAHTLDPLFVATACADRSITIRHVSLGIGSEVALDPYLSTTFPEDTNVTALAWSHFQPNILNCCVARDSEDVLCTNPAALSASTMYRYDMRVGLGPGKHVFEFKMDGIRMLCVEQFTEMQTLVGGEGGELLQVDVRKSGDVALVNSVQDPFCEAIGSIEYNVQASAFLTCGMTDFTVWKQGLSGTLSGAAQPAFHSIVNDNRAQRVNDSSFNIAATFVDSKTLFTTTSTGLASSLTFDLSKAIVQSPEEMAEARERRKRR